MRSNMCTVAFLMVVASGSAECADEPVKNIEGWGTIEDSMGGAKIEVMDGTLVMIAPKAYRDNVPGRKFNAPRLTQPASGDFTVEVNVTHVDTAKQKSVLKSLGGFSTAYHAGTLLVRGDQRNAIRFARVSMNTNGQLSTTCDLQVYEDGKLTTHVSEEIEESATHLKLTRQGDMLQCGFSQDDGKTWKKLPLHQLRNLTGPVQVGVSLTSNTDPGCTVKFRDLKLVSE